MDVGKGGGGKEKGRGPRSLCYFFSLRTVGEGDEGKKKRKEKEGGAKNRASSFLEMQDPSFSVPFGDGTERGGGKKKKRRERGGEFSSELNVARPILGDQPMGMEEEGGVKKKKKKVKRRGLARGGQELQLR